MKQKSKRVYRWAKNGAIFGLLLALADLTGWRGAIYPENAGAVVIAGQMIGSMVGGAIMFSIPAMITTLILRDESRGTQ